MGIRLSEIRARLRTIPVKWGDESFNVTYRLGERTMGAGAGDETTRLWLSRVLESWDILDDDGTPVPVTDETVADIPIPILNAVMAAIYGDDGVGEAESNSDAS